jgi:hypothetical protein
MEEQSNKLKRFLRAKIKKKQGEYNKQEITGPRQENVQFVNSFIENLFMAKLF